MAVLGQPPEPFEFDLVLIVVPCLRIIVAEPTPAIVPFDLSLPPSVMTGCPPWIFRFLTILSWAGSLLRFDPLWSELDECHSGGLCGSSSVQGPYIPPPSREHEQKLIGAPPLAQHKPSLIDESHAREA